ncbi:alpha/beta hydrolase fold domain-containing protein [Kineococcus sp. LSe6-4]|uniref:Alpha/beta hydrolase fold domain-containing protein n=1 Tax=Kineococcus halophytocola TaxID=3234027 RepID=A0ABV4GZN6_9ACTN
MTACPVLDPRLTDPQAAQVHAARALLDASLVPRHLAGLAVARARARRTAEAGPDLDVHRRDLVVRGGAGPRPARLYVPAGPEPAATVLFLHGGGWALGDLDTDDLLCRRLAAAAGVAVLSLSYRLAPEHPWPAALDDACAVLEALAAGRVPGPTGPLVVAGHGAGGQLAAVLALSARTGRVPPLVHQLLLCPLLDDDLDRDSHRRYGQGLGLSVDDLAWFWRMYVPDRAARHRPDVAPARARDVSGVVPTTVVVAGADPVRDEGLAYAATLRSAGVDVREVLVEGVPHDVLTTPGVPAGERVVRAAAEHLTATLSAPRVLDLREGVAQPR